MKLILLKLIDYCLHDMNNQPTIHSRLCSFIYMNQSTTDEASPFVAGMDARKIIYPSSIKVDKIFVRFNTIAI